MAYLQTFSDDQLKAVMRCYRAAVRSESDMCPVSLEAFGRLAGYVATEQERRDFVRLGGLTIDEII